MPKNSNKSSQNPNGSKKELKQEELQVDFGPLEFSNDPAHFELLNKKLRALKKKLRKITELEGKDPTKLNPDQINTISSKPQVVANLKEIEEIKKSVSNLDLTKELRLVSHSVPIYHYYIAKFGGRVFNISGC